MMVSSRNSEVTLWKLFVSFRISLRIIKEKYGLRNASDSLVTHFIYVKIKPYLISLLVWQRRRGFKLFPQQKDATQLSFRMVGDKLRKFISKCDRLG